MLFPAKPVLSTAIALDISLASHRPLKYQSVPPPFGSCIPNEYIFDGRHPIDSPMLPFVSWTAGAGA
jgi:hypothetical protein